MGGKTTKLFKNSTQPSSKTHEDETDFRNHKIHDRPQCLQPTNQTNKDPISPFVYYRRG